MKENEKKLEEVTKWLQLHTGDNFLLEDLLRYKTPEEIAIFMYDYGQSMRGKMISVEEKLPTVIPCRYSVMVASPIFEVYGNEFGSMKAIYVLNESGEPEWQNTERKTITGVTHWIGLHALHNLNPLKPKNEDQ